MQFKSIKVGSRDTLGSGASRGLRNAGSLPCVIYGYLEAKPIHGVLNAHELMLELREGKFSSQVYELDLGDKKILAVAKELQVDPVFGRPLHVDFLTVSEQKKVQVRVGIKFINKEQSKVLKSGGTLSITNMHLNLRCPLNAVPEKIVIDLANYGAACSIQAADLTLPAGVELANRKKTLVGVILPPKSKGKSAQASGESDS